MLLSLCLETAKGREPMKKFAPGLLAALGAFALQLEGLQNEISFQTLNGVTSKYASVM